MLPKNPPPRMKLTPTGHAIVGFREEEWVEDKTTNHWDQLADDLEGRYEHPFCRVVAISEN